MTLFQHCRPGWKQKTLRSWQLRAEGLSQINRLVVFSPTPNLQAADCCFIYFFSSTESFYDSSDNNWQTSRKLKWNEDGQNLRECCQTGVCFSVLRPNLFFTINQHAVVAKQSSDPQHIHKRGKVKQRAHLSLPLIIQDMISKKRKLS